MKVWMRRRRGLNNAAMVSVDATTASCDSPPASVRKRYCKDHAAEVDQDQHRCERAVDEGAVDDQVYVVEVVLEDRYTHGDGYAEEGGDPHQVGEH